MQLLHCHVGMGSESFQIINPPKKKMFRYNHFFKSSSTSANCHDRRPMLQISMHLAGVLQQDWRAQGSRQASLRSAFRRASCGGDAFVRPPSEILVEDHPPGRAVVAQLTAVLTSATKVIYIYTYIHINIYIHI
jgi:hypothetical protein